MYALVQSKCPVNVSLTMAMRNHTRTEQVETDTSSSVFSQLLTVTLQASRTPSVTISSISFPCWQTMGIISDGLVRHDFLL